MLNYSKLVNKIIAILIASAFLPYLPGGMRAEHLIFPSIFVIFLVVSFLKSKPISLALILISTLLFVGAVFSFAGSLFSIDAGVAAPILSMGIRLLLPSVIIAALAVLLPVRFDLVKITSVSIVLMAIPISLISISSSLVDLSSFLVYFINVDSIWSQAFSLGRFTGVFNQPLEAGVFFSISLFALVYLSSIQWRSFSEKFIIFGLILIGGSLSLSKNFIVLGIFLSLIYAASARVVSLRSTIFLFFVIFVSIWLWLVFGNEIYANAFFELFSEGGLLLALTAGRLGTGDTEVAQLWSSLLTSGKWVTGFGLGSYLPLDNGYLEYFYQGGIFSVISYIAFIIAILIFSVMRWEIAESKLLFSLSIFIAASSLGGPVVTANRANVPLLVLLVACVLTINYKKFIIKRVYE